MPKHDIIGRFKHIWRYYLHLLLVINNFIICQYFWTRYYLHYWSTTVTTGHKGENRIYAVYLKFRSSTIRWQHTKCNPTEWKLAGVEWELVKVEGTQTLCLPWRQMLVSNRAPAQEKTIQRSLKKRNNNSEGAMTK